MAVKSIQTILVGVTSLKISVRKNRIRFPTIYFGLCNSIKCVYAYNSCAAQCIIIAWPIIKYIASHTALPAFFARCGEAQ